MIRFAGQLFVLVSVLIAEIKDPCEVLGRSKGAGGSGRHGFLELEMIGWRYGGLLEFDEFGSLWCFYLLSMEVAWRMANIELLIMNAH